MSEILLIVGNTNAGKDYIASTRFKNFTLVKCNAAFKAVFEEDHYLIPGSCEDRVRRGETLVKGPLKGNTIQEGMVISYEQSLSGCGYGSKFATLTILKTLEKLDTLAKSRTPVVITDLRKPSELKFIFEFSKLVDYNIRMLRVKSDAETPQRSDVSLMSNLSLFEYLAHKEVEVCLNNRNKCPWNSGL